MGLIEIVLIIIGLVAFVLGFFLPSDKGSSSQNSVRIDEEDIRNVVDKEIEDAKSQISDIVDETITYAMEKTERSMDRLTNEKMLAVNEYSDTVLGEINKNHKEVVFLYDMLNDKHDSLKATVSEAIKTDSEIRQVSRDAEITAREMLEKVKEVQESVDEALVSAKPVNDIPVENTGESRDKGTEAFSAQKSEEGNGFTPMNAGEVGVVMPGSEVSVIGAESGGKLNSAEKTPKSVKKSAREEEVPDFPAEAEEYVPSPEASSFPDEIGNESEKNNNDRILQLHKAGKSNMAIARELGLGIGEVKLVIDLFEGA